MRDLQRLQEKISNRELRALVPFTQKSSFLDVSRGSFLTSREQMSKISIKEPSSLSFGELIKIGSNSDISQNAQNALHAQLQDMSPWRKGPFSLFGIHIDSEWQCQMKWARLKNHIQPLLGRRILDVGSGNGYYGFRMLQDGADLVVGLEPHLPYLSQFWAIKLFAPEADNYVLPHRLEEIASKSYSFDTVFSMGVIYHRRSPLDHLLQLKSCLAPTGELVLETLFIEGRTGFCLVPNQKYARMSNVWFIPTIGTLEQWLKRCGYSNVNIVDTSATTKQEQRKTEWMPFESLEDGLDQKNGTKTIEGYPSPKRVIIIASLRS